MSAASIPQTRRAGNEKGGAKAAKDIEELVSEVTGMFAGGELSEDAIEGAYKALTDAYWIAKENNKKYAPKTRRKKSDQRYLSYTLFAIP